MESHSAEGAVEAVDGQSLMMNLLDKLCDHMTNERIKLLIDNGFEEWETLTYLKGGELVELGFNSEEVIVIMMAINTTAKEAKLKEVFEEGTVHEVMQHAKQAEEQKMQKAIEQQESIDSQRLSGEQNSPSAFKQTQVLGQIELKQYPSKQLTLAMMEKSIPGAKPSSTKNIDKDKPSLGKVTLLQLQDKQITHLGRQVMQKAPQIQNLYLAHNRIYQIGDSLLSLSKIKVLRLEDNLLTKIEGLESLVNLERLTLNENYLQVIDNLGANKNLHYLNVSSQRHKFSVRFDEQMCYELAYSLEKFECNNNRVKNIDALGNLAVVQEVSLKNNLLEQIGELTTALGQMERLKKIDFKGNPLAKVPKYRDYIVILSKSLQELDDKKILPKEREYLVKLYSLKHAKQQKEQTEGENPAKIAPKANKQMNLQGQKLDENETGQTPKYVHGSDLRGMAPFSNTKVIKR